MPEGVKPLFYNFRTGQPMPCRVQLLANRTYYVRNDGRDTNSGLVDSASGAFLTIQKAIDAVKSIDLGIYNITIQVRNGTFAPFTLQGALIGGGRLTMLGNTTTPSSCIIQETTQNTSAVGVFRSQLDIGGFRLISANQSGIHLGDYGTVDFVGNMSFGAASEARIKCDNNAIFFSEDKNIDIDGNSQSFFRTEASGIIKCFGGTVTLTGTPNFSNAFADATEISYINAPNLTFVGGATGSRYRVQQNSIINTNGGGATYFPGDAAGTTATGGQYL